MMRSLWNGISGLNAHQVAMDVEANNIANVNTVGFKYARTNFQNLLSQTIKSATAPQENLGGRNSLQIGLGTNVSSVETMFKQGSIQNTDKNTDMAINGDGFFVVSGDGGKTYRYTRAGDFTFDANGNLVDPNGMVVQGWLADSNTHKIDTATSVQPITIPPGLTTPANATSKIQIKANLNSGNHINEMSGARSTVDQTLDLNGLYNANGEKIVLKEGDEFKFTLKKSDGTTTNVTLTYGESTTDTDGKFKTIKDLLDEINARIKDSTGKTHYLVFLNGDGRISDPNDAVTYLDSASNNNSKLSEILKALNGPAKSSESIKAIQNSFIGADDVSELFNMNGDSFNLKNGEGVQVNINGLGENRKFIYRSKDDNSCTTNDFYQDTNNIFTSDSNEGLHWLYNSNGERAYMNVGEKIKFSVQDSNNNSYTFNYVYGKDFQTFDELVCKLNADLNKNNINDTVKFENGELVENNNSIKQISFEDTNGTVYDSTTNKNDRLQKLEKIFEPLGSGTESDTFYKNDIYYFHDIQDLLNIWQIALDDSGDPLNSNTNNKGIVSLKDGKINIKNLSSNSFNIKVTGYPDNDEDNNLFTDVFTTLNGTLSANAEISSQALNAATHTTSIDIFDSLGSKHTVTLHFRKTHTYTGENDLSQWNWYAETTEPSTLGQPAYGYIKFNSDGSVNSYNPPNLTFHPNNGANPNQTINLNLGNLGKFDGITSFEAPSSTNGQTQDGYSGGELENLVVDQTGTIIGVFTNGRSYSLAQVGIAKFVNNEGLMSEGGSLFSASPNSGEPIIGTAGTGGRGSIQPSSLEMSNVDLSRSLTQLIVIQRGFQANSKTITTSDQMLNTLLQLKQ